MTTVPDIPVMRLPAIAGDDLAGSAASMWAVDIPKSRRPSPLALAALGVLAGIAAMALGAAAVLSAGSSPEKASADGVGVSQPQVAPAAPPVERRALALLAKPSTERVAFTGSPGLVLAVGSGGRAAILLRGLERAEVGNPYRAWIVVPGAAPIRAAQFGGVEQAVFLSRALGPRASVVISTNRPATPLERNRVVAVR